MFTSAWKPTPRVLHRDSHENTYSAALPRSSAMVKNFSPGRARFDVHVVVEVGEVEVFLSQPPHSSRFARLARRDWMDGQQAAHPV